MTEKPPVVIIVDDDASFRSFLVRLIGTVGLKTIQFASAEEFLASAPPDCPACLVLDVQMPGLSGLDLQRQLADGRRALPIVFMTGHGDIPMTVEAMKAGAVGFLPKPFRNQDLIDAVKEGLNRDREARTRLAEDNDLRKRYESLTAREREVFALVTAGSLNKQIAHQLGTSERTIKAHRAQVVLKMQADSVADLVRMADKLGIGVGQR
ncbi:MAG TPA: response regulator transcription factor [Pyrinomonadaceae bacterium]|jgi:Response regulator|nr:response regulator transcription factor [Pyrinomonadaceae bacterium]